MTALNAAATVTRMSDLLISNCSLKAEMINHVLGCRSDGFVDPEVKTRYCSHCRRTT